MTMAVVFCGTHEFGQHLGDTITSIRVAWMFAHTYPCSRYLLVLSPRHDLNFMWQKFIDTYNVQVVYDTFHPGNADERFNTWNRWREERQINGIKFDLYRELYRRIDGGHRQGLLCGMERGLGRKNVFDYFFYGQEGCPEEPPIGGSDFDGPRYFYHPPIRPVRDVYIAPYAKCQGNHVFTFAYWTKVVHRLIDEGLTVTVGHNGNFCEDLIGHPNYRKHWGSMQDLQNQVCQHRLVSCGNTGTGWMSAACGVPLLAMQPPDSHIQDYRYEWCGVKSLVEFLDTPDVEYCVGRIIEECSRMLVFTSGTYDRLTSADMKHLEESRSLGNRLVVGIPNGESSDERAAVLRACRWVDEVVVYDESPSKVVAELRPQVVTTHEMADRPGCIPLSVEDRTFIESNGGRVHVTGSDRVVANQQVIKRVAKATELVRAIKDIGHLSVNPANKLRLMAEQCQSVIDLPGAIADVGCYRGGCSVVFRRLAPEKDLHVLDSFAGNVNFDPLCHHKPGEWVADFAEVKKAVGESAFTHYHKGPIQDTMPADLDQTRFAFAYVDVDTYQATKFALEFLWSRMVPGGKLMVDDMPWVPCAGVEKAVREMFKEDQFTAFPDEHAVVITKPRE